MEHDDECRTTTQMSMSMRLNPCQYARHAVASGVCLGREQRSHNVDAPRHLLSLFMPIRREDCLRPREIEYATTMAPYTAMASQRVGSLGGAAGASELLFVPNAGFDLWPL